MKQCINVFVNICSESSAGRRDRDVAGRGGMKGSDARDTNHKIYYYGNIHISLHPILIWIKIVHLVLFKLVMTIVLSFFWFGNSKPA